MTTNLIERINEDPHILDNMRLLKNLSENFQDTCILANPELSKNSVFLDVLLGELHLGHISIQKQYRNVQQQLFTGKLNVDYSGFIWPGTRGNGYKVSVVKSLDEIKNLTIYCEKKEITPHIKMFLDSCEERYATAPALDPSINKKTLHQALLLLGREESRPYIDEISDEMMVEYFSIDTNDLSIRNQKETTWNLNASEFSFFGAEGDFVDGDYAICISHKDIPDNYPIIMFSYEIGYDYLRIVQHQGVSQETIRSWDKQARRRATAILEKHDIPKLSVDLATQIAAQVNIPFLEILPAEQNKNYDEPVIFSGSIKDVQKRLRTIYNEAAIRLGFKQPDDIRKCYYKKLSSKSLSKSIAC